MWYFFAFTLKLIILTEQGGKDKSRVRDREKDSLRHPVEPLEKERDRDKSCDEYVTEREKEILWDYL